MNSISLALATFRPLSRLFLLTALFAFLLSSEAQALDSASPATRPLPAAPAHVSSAPRTTGVAKPTKRRVHKKKTRRPAPPKKEPLSKIAGVEVQR